MNESGRPSGEMHEQEGLFPDPLAAAREEQLGRIPEPVQPPESDREAGAEPEAPRVGLTERSQLYMQRVRKGEAEVNDGILEPRWNQAGNLVSAESSVAAELAGERVVQEQAAKSAAAKDAEYEAARAAQAESTRATLSRLRDEGKLPEKSIHSPHARAEIRRAMEVGERKRAALEGAAEVPREAGTSEEEGWPRDVEAVRRRLKEVIEEHERRKNPPAD